MATDRNFRKLLDDQCDAGRFVCVGLDSRLGRLPAHLKAHLPGQNLALHPQYVFNKAIIDATYMTVSCYKINPAPYVAQGWAGWRVMEMTVEYINKTAPWIPVILDARWDGTGIPMEDYAKAAFRQIRADAITVGFSSGMEAMLPVLDDPTKGVFVVCRTPNSGNEEFQNQELSMPPVPLWQYVATRVEEAWNFNGNCGLVVGTSDANEMRTIRQMVGNRLPILAPDVNPFNNSPAAMLWAGLNANRGGLVLSSSGPVLFASGEGNFAEAAAAVAQRMHNDITATLASL